jgi:hypothetical protein
MTFPVVYLVMEDRPSDLGGIETRVIGAFAREAGAEAMKKDKPGSIFYPTEDSHRWVKRQAVTP